MTIKHYNGGPLPAGKWIVTLSGTKLQITGPAAQFSVYQQIICDTEHEAERMRLLLERRREEIEAVERRYELLIDAEVSS